MRDLAPQIAGGNRWQIKAEIVDQVPEGTCFASIALSGLPDGATVKLFDSMHPVFDYPHQRRLKKAQLYDNTRSCQVRGIVPLMETPMRGESLVMGNG